MIVALLLRSWHINKPEGLWNDEYVAWFISSQNSFESFFRELNQNCHMPLYYLYLKVWSFLFSDSDLSLRLSSVVCSISSVFVMFLAGKEIKDEKNGFLCAILCTISSFLIYFAQEVRIYSLLFLITSYSLLAWIKCAKETNLKNYLNLLTANALLIFTHTIGFVFVFFNISALLVLKIKENKIKRNKLFLFSLPYFIILPFFYIFAVDYE